MREKGRMKDERGIKIFDPHSWNLSNRSKVSTRLFFIIEKVQFTKLRNKRELNVLIIFIRIKEFAIQYKVDGHHEQWQTS